ncbi:MAG: glycerophosphodiester phosphodiesterase [Lachnospiraceae bacterium]|nr:glycerophosphodiester phosphodiesterase [Lachnospiraceae bacterium]
MKKFFKLLAAAFTAFIGAVLFLVCPKKCTDKKLRKIVAGRYFAHRGLHTKDKSVPENSLEAFRLAKEAGYGIELDIQLTKDDEIVVFHDDELKRVCNVPGKIWDYTYAELQEFRLENTNQRIPLFKDVLEVVDGKVPLIVELKDGIKNRALCEKAYAMLKDYKGEFCVESFQPLIVRWFYLFAPELLRGQLSDVPEEFEKKLGKVVSFMQGHLMFNFVGHPNFVAYTNAVCNPCEVDFATVAAPKSLELTKKLGAMQVVWTVRDEAACKYYEKTKDAIIFEYIRPATHFAKK